MTPALHHVALSVADLERAVHFWCELVGLAPFTAVLDLGDPAIARVMGLDRVAGRMQVVGSAALALELFEFHHPPRGPAPANRSLADPGLSHFGIAVDDLDALCARLAAAGVPLLGPVTRIGGHRAVYARDPEGNSFELLARA
ncbi:MAG: VOC family protein [Porticoccaceae bacterium]|nr:MAG: VOC family protein [Porticoccaceae bacterium]